MVHVSAPGKVHLIGEHSVVYGKPAIIAAIGMRCYINASEGDDVSIYSKNLDGKKTYSLEEVSEFTNNLNKVWEECYRIGSFKELMNILKENSFNPLKAMVGKSLEKLGIDHGISLDINSEIPMGAGVGSSAALSVAIPKAVTEVYSIGLSNEKLNEIAFDIEKLNHGTPSGGDNSTCYFGGLVWFQKGNPNIVNSLKREIPYELENFVLVYTKKPEKTTADLVQLVRDLEPAFRNKKMAELSEATYQLKEALKQKDFRKIKELINYTHENLSELGVSTDELDEINERVKEIGGAAKLCGAGGGGMMLCYHEDKKRLADTIRDLGYSPWETELGVEGVRIEK
jgi:mevalonate kinase